MKTYKNVKCVQKIKCVKVRALFPENKVRFARAEQLWTKVIGSSTMKQVARAYIPSYLLMAPMRHRGNLGIYRPTTNDRPQGPFTHFAKIWNGHNSATRQPIPFMFGSRLGFLGDGGSNCTISGSIKSKMAAGGHLEKLQMVISQQCIIQFIVLVCRPMYADHTLPSVSNL